MIRFVVLFFVTLSFVGCRNRADYEADIRKNLGCDVNITKLDYSRSACFFAQKPNGEVWVCDYTDGGVGTYKMFPAVK